MGRTRKHDTGLPERVYERRGSFFYVRDGKWTNLGKDRASAIEAAFALNIPPTSDQRAVADYAYRVLARARQNAKGRRGILFDLTKEDVLALLHEANWRCAVTRTPFILDAVGTRGDRPLAPSIDRKDSTKGYTRENCRIVCVAANFAMNRWGDWVLRTMLTHMHRAKEN